MYSYEERLRAVKLYIKYDHSLSAVIRELGYPSHQALLQWYREYITQGDLHAECVRHRRRCKFTMEQRKAAVAYYQEHGQNLARTVKKLGYPSRATLFNWLKEDIGRATHGGADKILDYADRPSFCLYSSGLSPPRDILIRFSRYQTI